MNIGFYVLLIIGLSIYGGRVKGATIPVCDSTRAIECGQGATDLALATGCQFSIVMPSFVECVSNYTSGCDSSQQVYFQAFIESYNQSLVANLCYNACTNEEAIRAQITGCEGLYGGLSVLAGEIEATSARPTDTACALALKRIKTCMLNATVDCKKLENLAIDTLNTESQAFVQCDIPLPDLDLSATATPTIGDVVTQFEAGLADSGTVINESTKTSLYVVLGLCCLVVLVSGVIIIWLWLKGQRDANFKQKNADSQAADTTDREDYGTGTVPRGSFARNFFTRDRSPRRAQIQPRDFEDYDEYDKFRQHSIGPYKAGADRWWTRPGFGTYGPEARVKDF